MCYAVTRTHVLILLTYWTGNRNLMPVTLFCPSYSCSFAQKRRLPSPPTSGSGRKSSLICGRRKSCQVDQRKSCKGSFKLQTLHAHGEIMLQQSPPTCCSNNRHLLFTRYMLLLFNRSRRSNYTGGLPSAFDAKSAIIFANGHENHLFFSLSTKGLQLVTKQKAALMISEPPLSLIF